MKHIHDSGNSPAKKKPNLNGNRFEMLVDEMADSGTTTAASSPDGSPGQAGRRSPTPSGNSSPPANPFQPSSGGDRDITPPAWFMAFETRQRAEFVSFEKRQNSRLEAILGQCNESHKCLSHEINELKDQVNKLSVKLVEAEKKIDDLENRGRRNNLVLYKVPEGKEKNNCIAFVADILVQAGLQGANSSNIQRAHRTGKTPTTSTSTGMPSTSRPRPIHIGFASFREKEEAKRALISHFKAKNNGDSGKFAVSDDYSVRVQKLRKEKIPELKRLRQEGKNAFLVFPAEIRINKN